MTKYTVYDIADEGISNPKTDDLKDFEGDQIEAISDEASVEEWVTYHSEHWDRDYEQGNVLVVSPDGTRSIYSFEYEYVPRIEIAKES